MLDEETDSQPPTPQPNISSERSEPISNHILCGTQWPDGVQSKARRQMPAATVRRKTTNLKNVKDRNVFSLQEEQQVLPN